MRMDKDSKEEGLTTFTLWEYIMQDNIMKNLCGGVYAEDLLPPHNNDKKIFIINSDNSKMPGKHWIAIYLNDKYSIFFCSFGKSPLSYSKNIQLFLKKQGKPVLYNKRRLQDNDSNTCGYYVLLFSILMSRNIPLNIFNDLFHQNTKNNDITVKRMIKNYFSLE